MESDRPRRGDPNAVLLPKGSAPFGAAKGGGFQQPRISSAVTKGTLLRSFLQLCLAQPLDARFITVIKAVIMFKCELRVGIATTWG